MSDTIENLQPDLEQPTAELDAVALAKLEELRKKALEEAAAKLAAEEAAAKLAAEEAAAKLAAEEAKAESKEEGHDEEHHCFSDEHCQPPAGFEVFEGKELAPVSTPPSMVEGVN